jgi:integrase
MSVAESQNRGWAVKRGRQWEARWIGADGKRHAKRGFAGKRAAEAYAREQTDEARKVASGQLAGDRPRTVSELLDAFEEAYERTGMRGRAPEESTLQTTRDRLQHARRRFGTRAPESLTKGEVEDWRAELPAGSKHDAFRTFRMAWTWARKRGLVQSDPTADISNPRRRRHERRPIEVFASWEEVESLATELGAVYGALVTLMVATGLRPEEAFALTRADVTYDHEKRSGVLHIRRRYSQGRFMESTKTHVDRRVPFGARVYAALRGLPARVDTALLFATPRGCPIDADAFRNREWLPALRAAGLPRRTLYSTRHTFITWSIDAGTPVPIVAELTGTSITQIQSTYHRPLESALARYVAAVDGYGEVVAS